MSKASILDCIVNTIQDDLEAEGYFICEPAMLPSADSSVAHLKTSTLYTVITVRISSVDVTVGTFNSREARRVSLSDPDLYDKVVESVNKIAEIAAEFSKQQLKEKNEQSITS